MFYRRAGIFHTNYRADRSLFPIPFERNAILVVFAIALAAPWIFSSLALTSYIRPWLIWTSAVLGLNLILGWAGQFHFGYAAIMAIGAYASVHATRHGVPWEIAIVLGGLTATVVGVVFAFAALRVKGLYLALSTLALQFVMDWVISHVPAISGGVSATLQAPPMETLIARTSQPDGGEEAAPESLGVQRMRVVDRGTYTRPVGSRGLVEDHTETRRDDYGRFQPGEGRQPHRPPDARQAR